MLFTNQSVPRISVSCVAFLRFWLESIKSGLGRLESFERNNLFDDSLSKCFLAIKIQDQYFETQQCFETLCSFFCNLLLYTMVASASVFRCWPRSLSRSAGLPRAQHAVRGILAPNAVRRVMASRRRAPTGPASQLALA